MTDALDPAEVAAVCAYMNAHQADSLRFIVRRLAGVDDLEAAELVDITAVDAVLTVRGANATPTEVRVPWPAPVATRADMKDQLFALLDRAATR